MRITPGKVPQTLMIMLVVGMALWVPGITTAQSSTTTCAQLLSNVEQHLSAGCQTMDRDEVCYGNRQITVEYIDAAGQNTLTKEGDSAPLNTIKSLKAGPLNPDNGEWGVAVIKTQPVGLEGTASGQVVTFVVYGDTTLAGQAVPTGTAGQAPVATTCTGTLTRASYLRAKPGPNEPQVQLLQPGTGATLTGRSVVGQWLYGESQGQKGWLFKDVLSLDCDSATLPINDPTVETIPGVNAFYFTTGTGAQASCKDIPPAGLFVQSPKGSTITFKLNGADIMMGSTGIFTFNRSAQPGGANQINIWTIDGEIGVVVGGALFRVPAGQARTFPLGGSDGLKLVNAPGALRPIASANQLAPIYIKTLCAVVKSAGLTVQGCNVKPPPTKPPVNNTQPTAPPVTPNTCQPTQPGLPCNCNGFCDPNGESYFTCPQDCPFAPVNPGGNNGGTCAPSGSSCNPSNPGACCSGKCNKLRTTYTCG